MTLVVRTPVPSERLSRPVREAVWQIDPELPVSPMTAVQEELDARLAERRHSTFVLALFAGAALFLAAIGVYGVLAYSVSQRSGEMGLRIAFGARARDLILLVLRDGFVLVVLGLGLGIIAALPLRRLIDALLFGVSPFDPVALVGACALLAGAAFVACYFPARRAAHVDPSIALRNE